MDYTWNDVDGPGDHMLLCGVCNGFPRFGQTEDCPRRALCPTCGKPTKRGDGSNCRSCAVRAFHGREDSR